MKHASKNGNAVYKAEASLEVMQYLVWSFLLTLGEPKVKNMKLGKSKTGPIYVICWYNNNFSYTVSAK